MISLRMGIPHAQQRPKDRLHKGHESAGMSLEKKQHGRLQRFGFAGVRISASSWPVPMD